MTKTSKIAEVETGTTLFVPLNKLKKSPRNARRMAHQAAHIEALAASIAAHGLLQSPVVEAERKEDGALTGNYLVTIGEGRRLAQLLRAKRKEIARTEPIRCVLESQHDAFEISLAENEVRASMHPADQFDAFHALHVEQGLSDEDIAARFGVTPAVVKQRLKLAAVSPALMERYREGILALDQLTAYAITDDHARQEAAFEQLGDDADREDILGLLNDAHIDAGDRRALFVGLEAYEAAGGQVLRDLFDPEHGGFLTDAALLHRLAQEKLECLAGEVRAEGWKWVETAFQQDYAALAGMRRIYPEAPPLSEEAEARIAELQAEYEALEAEEESEEVLAEANRIEQEIAALQGKEGFDPSSVARAGAVVSITRDGEPRIERGFIRPEDDERRERSKKQAKAHDGTQPLSEKLVAELTAHRTLALQEALGRQSDVALTATVHALAIRVFFPYESGASCLSLVASSPYLRSVAPGIEDSAAERALASRHDEWAKRLPEDAGGLWDCILGLGLNDRLALLAHCVSRSVDTVEKAQMSEAERLHAAQLVAATGIDMAASWTPTVANYLGRVSKERIIEAVREGVSKEAAENISGMKKQAMAENAEQRLQGKGWLPPMLRQPDRMPVEAV